MGATRPTRATILAFGVALACAWAAPAQNPARAQALPQDLPATNPVTTPADLAIGKRLFEGRCGHCHGQEGEGARGPALNAGRFRRGGSDRELFATIRNGIPNSEMPGVPNLPVKEVWRIVAHVQQLGRQGGEEATRGNAVAGSAVYRENGCATCHTIDGEGARLGPDLTDIGARRAPRHLRESVVAPGADIGLDYRAVSVVDRKGARITGIHLNEDEYSVHLRDMKGDLHSLMKSELAGITLPRESLMPPYPFLTATQLDDLVAYMSTSRANRTAAQDQVIWHFDRLDNIGGHKTTLLGEPVMIDSTVGKAVLFDGVDDALDIESHPLAGAQTFTWEAIFRPDGGEIEQRWFHLSQRDPATGLDTDNRMLFEIRVAGDNWFLDSFTQSGSASKALMNRTALHPLKAWYHVASVYDGREFRNYVDGVPEGSAEIEFAPHGPGHTSVGMRINKVFYFKGAVHLARFTRRALSPSEFLPPPRKP